MNKIFDLQLFADGETSAASSEPVTAENVQSEQATAEQGKEERADKAQGTKADEKKYSDKDLDRIIGRKFAEWKEKEQKAVDEAKKYAAMDAQEKSEYDLKKVTAERDEAQKQLAVYREKDTLSEMMKTSRKSLAVKGVSVSDEILALIVTTDAEKTKAAVDSFAALYKESVENEVKNRLRGETPKRGSAISTPISEIDKRINKYL